MEHKIRPIHRCCHVLEIEQITSYKRKALARVRIAQKGDLSGRKVIEACDVMAQSE